MRRILSAIASAGRRSVGLGSTQIADNALFRAASTGKLVVDFQSSVVSSRVSVAGFGNGGSVGTVDSTWDQLTGSSNELEIDLTVPANSGGITETFLVVVAAQGPVKFTQQTTQLALMQSIDSAAETHAMSHVTSGNDFTGESTPINPSLNMVYMVSVTGTGSTQSYAYKIRGKRDLGAVTAVIAPSNADHSTYEGPTIAALYGVVLTA